MAGRGITPASRHATVATLSCLILFLVSLCSCTVSTSPSHFSEKCCRARVHPPTPPDPRRRKGWAFNNGDGMVQCEREGWSDKMKQQADEGCNLKGFLTVNKVPGNFHIAPGKSFQQHHVHVHDLQSFGREGMGKVRGEARGGVEPGHHITRMHSPC